MNEYTNVGMDVRASSVTQAKRAARLEQASGVCPIASTTNMGPCQSFQVLTRPHFLQTRETGTWYLFQGTVVCSR